MEGLTVITNPYNYNAWKIYNEGSEEIIRSEPKLYHGKRCTDDWRREHIYEMCGLPVDYKEISRNDDHPAISATKQYRMLTAEALRSNHGVIAAGGFCNYAPALVGGIQEAYGSEIRIGVIWIDAHPDCHIAEEEADGTRLVAVPVSVMLGTTLEKYRTEICGLKVPIAGNCFLAAGVRIMDETAAAVYERTGVKWIQSDRFSDHTYFQKVVDDLAEHSDILFVSVDADIMNPRYVPSYIKSVSLGETPESVAENVRIVMRTGKVAVLSMFCFDFDLYEKHGEITSASGRKILAEAVKEWR